MKTVIGVIAALASTVAAAQSTTCYNVGNNVQCDSATGNTTCYKVGFNVQCDTTQAPRQFSVPAPANTYNPNAYWDGFNAMQQAQLRAMQIRQLREQEAARRCAAGDQRYC